MVSSLISSYISFTFFFILLLRKCTGFTPPHYEFRKQRPSTKLSSTSELQKGLVRPKDQTWWGRGGPPQKIPSFTLLPDRPSYSHQLVERDESSRPRNGSKSKSRRSTHVYKHLFRYYTDISVECWLATVTSEEFLLSCGYTRDEISTMAKDFPPLLGLDVRGHLAPKIRFLVRTLGGGEGDICNGECIDEVPPAKDEECQEFHPHNLIVSDVAKASVPPSYFGHRLERTVGPRHAYLEHSKTLPHGSVLLENDGSLLKEFLDACGKSTAEFASLCNRWETERVGRYSNPSHNSEKVDAFERAFGRGILAAARNGMTDELRMLDCTPGRMVQLLVGHGANPIEHDRSGASLLHWAAGTGNICGVKALLRAMDSQAVEGGRVADVIATTQTDKDGATSLHWSCCGVDHERFGCGGHVDVCRFLLDEAGDRCKELSNAQTITGNTPIMWACWSGSLDVAKLLVERGADPHFRNKNGCNAAHWASSGGHLQVCRYLCKELGVDFRVENEAGHTPLNHAICYERLDVVEWIIAEFYASEADAAALQREIDLAKAFVGEDGSKAIQMMEGIVNGRKMP